MVIFEVSMYPCSISKSKIEKLGVGVQKQSPPEILVSQKIEDGWSQFFGGFRIDDEGKIWMFPKMVVPPNHPF